MEIVWMGSVNALLDILELIVQLNMKFSLMGIPRLWVQTESNGSTWRSVSLWWLARSSHWTSTQTTKSWMFMWATNGQSLLLSTPTTWHSSIRKLWISIMMLTPIWKTSRSWSECTESFMSKTISMTTRWESHSQPLRHWKNQKKMQSSLMHNRANLPSKCLWENNKYTELLQ